MKGYLGIIVVWSLMDSIIVGEIHYCSFDGWMILPVNKSVLYLT